jgi:branched-chain amino acid transport system ATP-binding protein
MQAGGNEGFPARIESKEHRLMSARAIIEREHRSLAAVLHGMLHLTREIRFAGTRPDFVLFDAMTHYIQAFSERLHHPKEEAYLFERVSARCSEARPLLDRLKEEHVAGAVKFGELRGALERYRRSDAAFGEFASQLSQYAAFHWAHMRAEEDELLPLAQAHLTREDWDAIDAAFADNVDPLEGVKSGARYQALFKRIVELAPSPMGLAPKR